MAQGADGKRNTILCFTGGDSSFPSVERALANAGYNVKAAHHTSLEDCGAELRGFHADLVFCGFERFPSGDTSLYVFQWMKADEYYRDIPLVHVQEKPPVVPRGGSLPRLAGGFYYLIRPFSGDELLEVVGAALRKPWLTNYLEVAIWQT